jgi:hypothetical protein
MFSHIKYSAIFVGIFTHVTIAIIFFFLFAFFYRLFEQSQNQSLFALGMLTFLIVMRAIAYLATGYITAKIAKTQPLLHGVICGFFAIAFNTFLGINLFLSFFISLPAIVTGAYLYKNVLAKQQSS